jgi:hypothetical protein
MSRGDRWILDANRLATLHAVRLTRGAQPRQGADRDGGNVSIVIASATASW